MSIKPIDLQSNMTQMHEVGKNEQARTEALTEQQHLLEKESNEKSRLINTRLDEAKKNEKTLIEDQESKNKNRNKNLMKGNESESKKEEKDGIKRQGMIDEKIGRFIDILK